MWNGLSRSSPGKCSRNRFSYGFFITLVMLILTGVTSANSLGLTDQILELVAKQYGNRAKALIVNWQSIVDRNQHSSERQKLEVINKFINKNRFVDDLTHWQKKDYWATPIEFLATRGGDCEDFAIAKYFSLRALDVADSKLRLTYVKSLRLNQAHMVLSYYPSPTAEPLVLDNLMDKILPASRRKDLQPVYSFNGDGLWLAKTRGEGRRMGDAEDLNLWRDFLERMKR